MGFLEFATAISICVGLPSIILYNIRKIKEARYLGKGEHEGSALRTSELTVMIEDAVRRAVQPLVTQIDELEGGSEPAKLLEAPRSPILSAELAEFDAEEDLVPTGQSRVRN